MAKQRNVIVFSCNEKGVNRMLPRMFASMYVFLVGLVIWIWVCEFTEPFAWWKLPTAGTLFIVWLGIHIYIVWTSD